MAGSALIQNQQLEGRRASNYSGARRQQTHDGRNGTSAFTVVPRPGALSNSNVPRSCSTRSRILITPSPPDLLSTSGVQPTPSSDTERQTVPLDRVSRTSTFLASEYLAAFPSASCAIR